MKNFRTLQMAVSFYRLTDGLALRGDARDQLQRAARSIVLNLAEGRGKRTRADQVRFFSIAMGSVRECQAIMILERLEGSPAERMLDKVAAQLYRLMQNAIVPPG